MTNLILVLKEVSSSGWASNKTKTFIYSLILNLQNRFASGYFSYLSEQDKLRKLPHYKLFGRISHASSAKDGQTASNIYINIYHFQSLVFQYICTRFCVCIYTRAEKKKQEEVSNFAKYIKLQDSSKFVLI